MSQILQLPAEVLFLILELLAKRDIRSLRTVLRRVSRVAAHYQFGTVVLRDPNGRQRIKKAANMLGSYLERTRYVNGLHVAQSANQLSVQSAANTRQTPNQARIGRLHVQWYPFASKHIESSLPISSH